VWEGEAKIVRIFHLSRVTVTGFGLSDDSICIVSDVSWLRRDMPYVMRCRRRKKALSSVVRACVFFFSVVCAALVARSRADFLRMDKFVHHLLFFSIRKIQLCMLRLLSNDIN